MPGSKRKASQEAQVFVEICQPQKLVGGFSPTLLNPFETYTQVKLGSSSPIFGVKTKNI